MRGESHFLVGNLGDSKAIFCKRDFDGKGCTGKQPLLLSRRRKMRRTLGVMEGAVQRCLAGALCAEELHLVHQPNREDERARIESLGGTVEQRGGVWRVNGELAVSRAIGDLPFRPFVIPNPDFTDWHYVPSCLTEKDKKEESEQNDLQKLEKLKRGENRGEDIRTGQGRRDGQSDSRKESSHYLVVASDGVFEKLSSQQVCSILCAVENEVPVWQLFNDSVPIEAPIPLGPALEAHNLGLDFQENLKNLVTSSLREDLQKSGAADDVRKMSSSLPYLGSKKYERYELGLQGMAEAVVEVSFGLGSMDNMAVVISRLGKNIEEDNGRESINKMEKKSGISEEKQDVLLDWEPSRTFRVTESKEHRPNMVDDKFLTDAECLWKAEDFSNSEALLSSKEEDKSCPKINLEYSSLLGGTRQMVKSIENTAVVGAGVFFPTVSTNLASSAGGASSATVHMLVAGTDMPHCYQLLEQLISHEILSTGTVPEPLQENEPSLQPHWDDLTFPNNPNNFVMQQLNAGKVGRLELRSGLTGVNGAVEREKQGHEMGWLQTSDVYGKDKVVMDEVGGVEKSDHEEGKIRGVRIDRNNQGSSVSQSVLLSDIYGSKALMDVIYAHLVCPQPLSELCATSPPQGLSNFLQIIQSVPLDPLPLPSAEGVEPRVGSWLPPDGFAHNRYILEQNFARGGFGEVWLAKKREACSGSNCSYGFVPSGDGSCSQQDYENPGDGEKERAKSHGNSGKPEEETFILKRLLNVEGGRLSGLREKYFGELFRNATLLLGDKRRRVRVHTENRENPKNTETYVYENSMIAGEFQVSISERGENEGGTGSMFESVPNLGDFNDRGREEKEKHSVQENSKLGVREEIERGSLKSYKWVEDTDFKYEGETTEERRGEVKEIKKSKAIGDDDYEGTDPSGRFLEINESLSSENQLVGSDETIITQSTEGKPENVSVPMKVEYFERIARFVESFEVGKELWLVFVNEGVSLSSLLYSTEEGEPGKGGYQVVKPSDFWRFLRTTNAGKLALKSIMRQLMESLLVCHSHNITHRDIKPENMIIKTSWKSKRSSSPPSDTQPTSEIDVKMRLADFGSAIDSFSLAHLYNSHSPSRAEITEFYSPPEVLLGKARPTLPDLYSKGYDLWSTGVVFLELILGTPHVWALSSRTQALLERRLYGWDDSAKDTAYLLRAWMELCIQPGHSDHYKGNMETSQLKEGENPWREGFPAPWDCTEEALMRRIRQRDPLELGMPDIWALRFLRRLLQWYSGDRLSPEKALQHAYLRNDGSQGGFKCPLCKEEFEFVDECEHHLHAFHNHSEYSKPKGDDTRSLQMCI